MARDINVKKIKGRLPRFNERRRLANLKVNILVDKAILGATNDYLGHIKKENPRIIALGYDQQAYVGGLKNKLYGLGIRPITIRRMRPYKPGLYKSSHLAKA